MTDNEQPEGTNAAFIADGYDEPNPDALADYLAEMSEEETESLFILVGGLDPFERDAAGGYKYDQEQRDLIGKTKAAYESAGYSMPE